MHLCFLSFGWYFAAVSIECFCVSFDQIRRKIQNRIDCCNGWRAQEHAQCNQLRSKRLNGLIYGPWITVPTIYICSLSLIPTSKIQILSSPRLSRSPAMALSAAFKERLDQMEFTRNQRLHLLQVPNNPSLASHSFNRTIEFSMHATDFNNLPSVEVTESIHLRFKGDSMSRWLSVALNFVRNQIDLLFLFD